MHDSGDHASEADIHQLLLGRAKVLLEAGRRFLQSTVNAGQVAKCQLI
jgi:hypothetical protein